MQPTPAVYLKVLPVLSSLCIQSCSWHSLFSIVSMLGWFSISPAGKQKWQLGQTVMYSLPPVLNHCIWGLHTTLPSYFLGLRACAREALTIREPALSSLDIIYSYWTRKGRGSKSKTVNCGLFSQFSGDNTTHISCLVSSLPPSNIKPQLWASYHAYQKRPPKKKEKSLSWASIRSRNGYDWHR